MFNGSKVSENSQKFQEKSYSDLNISKFDSER